MTSSPWQGDAPHEEQGVAERVAREAARIVTGDRNSDYGHPLDDFTKVASMWTAVFGVPVRPEQVPLAMVCIKIARELNRPKADNSVDAVGYILALEMLKEERIRRSGE